LSCVKSQSKIGGNPGNYKEQNKNERELDERLASVTGLIMKEFSTP